MISIAFVCVKNSCRSLMAEAFSKIYKKGEYEIYSAGTLPTHSINENAVFAMAEKGIKMDNYYPKSVEEIPDVLDFVITMGDGMNCPTIKAKVRDHWGIDDPEGKKIPSYKKTRDSIEKKVKKLYKKIEKGAYDNVLSD